MRCAQAMATCRGCWRQHRRTDWLDSRHCSWHGACNVTTPRLPARLSIQASQTDVARETHYRSGQIEICHTSSSSRLSVIDAATVRSFVIYISTACPVSNNPFVPWRRRLGRCLQWSLHKLVSFVFASDTQCLECPLQHNSKQLESVHCVAVEFHVFNTGIVVIHAIIIVVWTILCASARALIKRNFCFSKIVSQNDAKIWNLFIRKQNLYVTIVMWRCIGWFYTHYNIPLLGRSFCFKTQFYFCRFLQHCGTSQNYTVNYRVSVSARRLWTVLFVYYVTLWYFNLYFSLLYR